MVYGKLWELHNLPEKFAIPKRMKNILLGVLLVALAAVVVNKKTWKHRTFLLIVVGILVTMMAVSMIFVGKEMFQTAGPTVATTGCTSTDVTYYINREGNFNGNETVNWNALMTNGSTNFNATRLGNYDDIPMRRWCYLLTSLYNVGCYDRILSFFAWAMGNQTLIFPAGTKAITYTDDLSVNSDNRYMNFVELAKQYRSDLFDTNGNVINVRTAAYFNTGTAPNNNGFHSMCYFSCRLMAIYTQLCLKRGMSGDMIKYIGMWLDRVTNYVNRVADGMYVFYGYRYIYKMISQTLSGLVGGATVCNGSVRTTNGINSAYSFLTNFTDTQTGTLNAINRIPGFIYDVALPSKTVIQDHSAYLSVLFYGLFIIKNSYQYKNIGYIWYNQPRGTITDRMNTVVGPIVRQIVKNLNSDEQIEADARTANLTAFQLDTVLRNYLGDAKCLQPLTLDGISAVIKGTTYSKDVLSADGSAIPSLGATIPDISNMMRAAIYKSNLDSNNQTWLGGPIGKSTTNTNQPMPSIADIASVKPARRNNFGMYAYLFENGSLPVDYFNGLSATDLFWSGYHWNAIFDGNLADFEAGLKMLADTIGLSDTTRQTTTTCISLAAPAPSPVSSTTSTFSPTMPPATALVTSPPPTTIQGFTPSLHYDPSLPGSYPGYGTVISNIGTASTVNGMFGTNTKVINGALDFDGTIAGTINPSKISFPAYNFGDVFTMTAWINPRTPIVSDKIMGLFGNRSSNTNTNGFHVCINTFSNDNRSMRIVIGNGSTQQELVQASTITYNTWQHVAFTFNRTTNTVSLYYNGTFVNSWPITITDISTNQPFFIGGFSTHYQPYNGQVGSLKIFGAALTAQQIMSEYNAGMAKYASAPTFSPTMPPATALVTSPTFAPTTIQGFTPSLHYDPSLPGSYPGYGTVISNIGTASTINGTFSPGISVSKGNLDLNRTVNNKLAITFTSLYNFGNVMTLSAWVSPRSTFGNMNILLGSNRPGKDGNQNILTGFILGWNNYSQTNVADGAMFFEYSNGVDWLGVGSPKQTITFDQWQHLVYQFDLTQTTPFVRLYKNGVQVASNGVKTGFSSNGPFTIGNGTNLGDGTTDALVGSLKVFGAALSAQQIKDEYNAGRTKYGLPAAI